MSRLSKCSHKDQCAMPYPDLLALRREAYAEHMENFPIPDEINVWARKLEFQQLNDWAYTEWCKKNEMVEDQAHKTEWVKTLGVWFQRLPLITAFMVIRWGEEPKEWPDKFTTDDIKRATTWFTNPKGHPGINAAIQAGV